MEVNKTYIDKDIKIEYADLNDLDDVMEEINDKMVDIKWNAHKFCRDTNCENYYAEISECMVMYRDWETDRKSTRLNSSHSAKSRMPSSA